MDGLNEVKEGGKGILKAFGLGSSSAGAGETTNAVDIMDFADSSDDEAGLEDALEVGDTFEETKEEIEIRIDNIEENVSNKIQKGQELIGDVTSDARDKLAGIAGTVGGNLKNKAKELKVDI